MNKNFKSLLALALCLVMMVSVFAGCTPDTPVVDNPNNNNNNNNDNTVVTPAVFKKAEYNTFTSVMPSNWNELTYQDNNDTQIMSYIGSSFFDYDYKFENDVKYNADGSINKDGIVDGAYTVNYSAATKLEDVTSTVAAKWGYTAKQKEDGGYAWKITLRDDLKWDDGTPITAADFVYSMQAQLDPDFMNYRANTFYDTLRIKNSRGYFYQNVEGTYDSVGSFGYESNAAAVADGKDVLIDVYAAWSSQGYLTLDGVECPQWLSISDTTVYYLMDENGQPALNEDGELVDCVSGKDCYDTYLAIGYGPYFEPGGQLDYCISIYTPNTTGAVAWEDVGIYAEGNAIVVCLDKAYSLLNKDGSLALWAAYYMSSLPLVHKDKYEAAKIAPEAGSTLWTSKYNSDLDTTASWGPYKLVEFEAGSHYVLAKNENWFGWNMEQYKNQYNITAINCIKIADQNAQWLGFIAGELDDASLTTDNINEYKDSKYVSYSPETGTYGMQLFSDLEVLKKSENNNGILAIQAFRHAFSLALNRADVVNTIWPGTAVVCLGLLNPMYYYDIENSPNLEDGGVYRNTVEAQEGLLRAYGFEQDANGRWSSGKLTNLTLEDAIEVLTGYNLTLAKEKLAEAIAELTANAEFYGYDATKDITFIYGSSADTDKQRQRAQYLQGVLDTLTEGSALQGKIKVVFDASAGSGWANAFRSGQTQIGFGYGFSGNAFNPFDIIGAFVDPDDQLNYHEYWDTSAVNLTITLPAGDYAGAGETITMSAQNWFFCLNGLADEKGAPVKYNWGEGFAPTNARLVILAALEELTLKECRSIMLIGGYNGALLGAKFSQFHEDYNTFMGFGGMRYMVVNYTDAEWTAFVAANNGDLTTEYKKAE